MWSFYRFVRQGVAENRPWDRFAREVVTARGSTLSNGAANYFVLHRDPIDLTESTSMAFLGMSLTCARCHNHPMEKWTQRDYYQFANLFARVRVKDDDRAFAAKGDTALVYSAEAGEILHPRLGVALPPRPLAPCGRRRAHGARCVPIATWVTPSAVRPLGAFTYGRVVPLAWPE